MPVLKANSTLLGNQLYLCSSPFCHSLCLWFWIFLWIFFAFTFVSTAFASSASSTKSARTNTAVVPPALALVFGLVLALALCCRCDQLPLVVDLDLKMKFLAVTSKQTLESRHDAPCHSSSWSPWAGQTLCARWWSAASAPSASVHCISQALQSSDQGDRSMKKFPQTVEPTARRRGSAPWWSCCHWTAGICWGFVQEPDYIASKKVLILELGHAKVWNHPWIWPCAWRGSGNGPLGMIPKWQKASHSIHARLRYRLGFHLQGPKLSSWSKQLWKRGSPKLNQLQKLNYVRILQDPGCSL